MKSTSLLIVVLFVLFGCKQKFVSSSTLQNRIDSLQNELNHSYKPGFGEFMSSIQVHHNKLWFAGVNENWRLADFEIHEMMEAIDNIQKYQQERKESKKVEMILPAFDSVNAAIEQKSIVKFKSSYVLLTNTCNECHVAVDFGFNVVKIPVTPPYSNQDFKLPAIKK